MPVLRPGDCVGMPEPRVEPEKKQPVLTDEFRDWYYRAPSSEVREAYNRGGETKILIDMIHWEEGKSDVQ